MKKQFIGDLKIGEAVNDTFVLMEKSVSQKKDGNNYLNVVLGDKTGHVKGVVWDRVDEITAAGVSSGDFVDIAGTVNEYRGGLQLVVKKMTTCPPESVDPADYLPTTRHSIDTMFERLAGQTGLIKNDFIRQLIQSFWSDPAFVKRFKAAPAAKNMHHAYIGGLLEHTLSMMLLAEKIAGHYSGIDMDLLYAGILLHDVGKVREFEYQYRIDYTDEGRLLSHIVIGLQMLEEKIKAIEGFPAETAVLLKHLIVSHHGAREFGSPELPKTIEAVLLNYIDEIDSKVNGIRSFMSAESSDESWTSYHRLLGRHFYIGKTREET
ncbi:MAG: HD domain-containing protein [Thermodesulfobacteriota bacterium]